MTDQLSWRQYICRVCGLVYDEKLGDPDSGLAPGTRFEDIPDDWYCPVCHVTKADFEPYELKVASSEPMARIASVGATGVVIVGSGVAGWSVAQAVRRTDVSIPITMVTGCNGDVYHKPELSVALSRDLSPERIRKEEGPAAAARLGVNLVCETQAMGLSTQQKQLRTTRGTLNYSHLVLAFGAKPALPKVLSGEHCWRVNDLQAWSGLYEQLREGPKRIAIVGAGMVGCEIAEDAARAGHDVILLDRTPYPLADLLPPPAAMRVGRALQGAGVLFLGGVQVQGIAGEGSQKRIQLAGRRPLDVDIVISATGLTTPPRLLKGAGIAFDNGIVVSPRTLETSAKDVYALGDCISLGGRPCRFIEPIGHHARAIASRIAGGSSEADYDIANVAIRLKTKSIALSLRGMPHPKGEWKLIRENDAELAMVQLMGSVVTSHLNAA
jgi:rubredoxin-NAD+ reductase